jgi:hypothetical protein
MLCGFLDHSCPTRPIEFQMKAAPAMLGTSRGLDGTCKGSTDMAQPITGPSCDCSGRDR